MSAKIKQIVPALLDWFAANARDLPWRRTQGPYAIWVSEIMLQQTQVKTVIPYWERWMRELPSIQALAEASPDRIHKLWEGLGYYTRVRNMQKAARLIVEKHGGRFPGRFEDVLELPGIGRYTAGAICSIAFNQPTPILDGNVIRVLTRVFAIGENPREKETNEKLWVLAGQLVAEAEIGDSRTTHYASRCSHLNQSLMELGALVCTPREPKCGRCPVQTRCVARKQARVDELPNLGKRVAATERRFVAFVCEKRGRFLVRQRPAGVVNAHLWEFPNMEAVAGNGNLKAMAAKLLGMMPVATEPFHTVKHSITRYRITLEAYRLEGVGRTLRGAGTWLRMRELERLAFTSAHKKVLNLLCVPDR